MNLKDSLRKYVRRSDSFEKLWNSNTGRDCDFSNPRTYNEKMWFLKLSNRDPLLTLCSDKHGAREYIKECGYADILKEEYAFFNSVEEIDFNKLPSPSYLKCNHASGMNLVYDKNKKLNEKHIRWKFRFLLRQNPYYLSREWNYKNIVPGIVCEEVLAMPDGVSDIPEVQFFCFNGVVRFIMYNLGLADANGAHKTATRWVFDPEWNHIDIKTSMPTDRDNIPPMPKNYRRMLEIATKLSAPFAHVRVDLFNIDGRIVFNELTFYSGGGFVKLEPSEWQEKVGDMFDVSGYQIADDAKLRHKKP